MMASAIIVALAGILAELAVRGGLNADWKLPITADTQFAPETGKGRRWTDVPTAYTGTR